MTVAYSRVVVYCGVTVECQTYDREVLGSTVRLPIETLSSDYYLDG